MGIYAPGMTYAHHVITTLCLLFLACSSEVSCRCNVSSSQNLQLHYERARHLSYGNESAANLSCCVSSATPLPVNGKFFWRRTTDLDRPSDGLSQSNASSLSSCVKRSAKSFQSVGFGTAGIHTCTFVPDNGKEALCGSTEVTVTGSIQAFEKYECAGIDFTTNTINISFPSVMDTRWTSDYILSTCLSQRSNAYCKGSSSVWRNETCVRYNDSVVCPFKADRPLHFPSESYAYKLLGRGAYIEMELYEELFGAIKFQHLLNRCIKPNEYFPEPPVVTLSTTYMDVAWLSRDVFVSVPSAVVTVVAVDSNESDVIKVSKLCPKSRTCSKRIPGLLPCTLYKCSIQWTFLTDREPWHSLYRTKPRDPNRVLEVRVIHKQRGHVYARWQPATDATFDAISYHAELSGDGELLRTIVTGDASATWWLNRTFDACELKLFSCNRCKCSEPAIHTFRCGEPQKEQSKAGEDSGADPVLWWSLSACAVVVLIGVAILLLFLRYKHNQRRNNLTRGQPIEINDPLYEDVMNGDVVVRYR